MKTFEYQGFATSGGRARGLIEADDVKQARDKLSARGVLPETVRPVDPARAGRGRGLKNPAARAALYRQLASLLRSGLPLAGALEVLLDTPEEPALHAQLAAWRDRIREGGGPAEALRAVTALSLYEAAAWEAGQRAGALEPILDRLAGFLEEQLAWREKMLAALIYPLVVALVALGAAVLLLGYLLPSFARMWTEAQIPLPRITAATLALGRGLIRFLPAGLLLGAASFFYVRRRARGSVARERAERWWFRRAGFGRAWAALVSLRFSRTLALLLRGGVPALEALPLAGSATGSVWIDRRVREETESVRHGGRIADAVRRIEPLRLHLPGWVQAGESAGDLEAMLEAAATRCRQRWERDVQRGMALVEPALILLLGAGVFVLALAILLPVLELNRGLGG